ncbi:MAG: hypothetical protein JWN84_258 [Nocardioides sp.]|nr:hypothetical protein [Nocardioides sp.]
MTTSRSTPGLTRRRALAGATTVGLALPVLSACGGGDESTATDVPSGSTSPGSGSPSAATSEAAPEATSAATAQPAGEGIVSTADVPVGSGVILDDEKVVVTQPTEGDIKVFSSICTHTGCPVSGISDTISCPCHGSSFDLATGDVLGGPASAPLAQLAFTVEGDQVVLS